MLIMTWFADRSWTEAFCVCPKPLYEEGRVLFQPMSTPSARSWAAVVTGPWSQRPSRGRLRARRPERQQQIDQVQHVDGAVPPLYRWPTVQGFRVGPEQSERARDSTGLGSRHE